MTNQPPSTNEPFTAQYDRLGDESISVAVAEAVATVRDEDVIELDPLHYTIDTDALERLFEPRINGTRTEGSVTFEYNGCTVAVSAAGEIIVESATYDSGD